MKDGRKTVWSIPYVSVAFFPSLKHNFIAYRSSKVSSRPDCIFEIHQPWQSGFSRVYFNGCCSCSFEAEIIKIGQSSHRMYSNNILNFHESTTILNAVTKKSGNLLNAPGISRYLVISFFDCITWPWLGIFLVSIPSLKSFNLSLQVSLTDLSFVLFCSFHPNIFPCFHPSFFTYCCNFFTCPFSLIYHPRFAYLFGLGGLINILPDLLAYIFLVFQVQKADLSLISFELGQQIFGLYY